MCVCVFFVCFVCVIRPHFAEILRKAQEENGMFCSTLDLSVIIQPSLCTSCLNTRSILSTSR